MPRRRVSITKTMQNTNDEAARNTVGDVMPKVKEEVVQDDGENNESSEYISFTTFVKMEQDDLENASNTAPQDDSRHEADEDEEDADVPEDMSVDFTDESSTWDVESETGDEDEEASPKRSLRQSQRRTSSVCSSDEDESWKEVSETDTYDHPRPQFTPSRTSGLQLDFSEEWTPLKVFQLFVTPEMVEGIVSRTRENHQHLKATRPKLYTLPRDFNIASFYRLLGVILFMGLVQLPHIKDYWSKDIIGQPFVKSSCVSEYFFFRVLWALHFSTINEDNEMEQKRKAEQPYDKLTKIRYVIDHIRKACKHYLAPWREISISERTVACTSQNSCLEEEAPVKPVKLGYKLWVLSCPHTGYIFDFAVNAGKKNDGHKGIAFSIIKNLSEDYLGCGHLIYVDNFYASQKLFDYLLSRNTLAVGPVRDDRGGFPSHASNPVTEKDKGKIKWFRSEGVVYFQWMRERIGRLASTAHLGHEATEIMQISQSKIGILKPHGLRDSITRGVDLSDHLIQKYSVHRRMNMHYRRLFLYCIHLSVTNAFIIYQQIQKQKNEKAMSHKEFVQTLVKELIATYPGKVRKRPRSPSPEKHNFYRRVGTTRRKCRVCPNGFTFTACLDCGDIPMCVMTHRNCFAKYHQENRIPFSLS